MVLENPDSDMQFKMNDCLLSVIMVTYNQESYIEQALKSVLNQRTNFRFQILIGDDASTDGTADIVRRYSKEYPEIIFPFLHPKNLGNLGKNNFIYVYSKCKTKYATILEGDDYWTDSDKLQKQVDFLEKNTNYSICFHSVNLLKNGVLKKDYLNNTTKSVTDIYDLAAGNYIRTLSCVFVNTLNGVLPDFYSHSIAGDYILHLLNAQKGKIYFMKEFMGVYRIHDKGIWSGNSQLEKNKDWLNLLDALLTYFEDKKLKNILNFQKCEILYSNTKLSENQEEKQRLITEAEKIIPGVIQKIERKKQRSLAAPSLIKRAIVKFKSLFNGAI